MTADGEAGPPRRRAKRERRLAKAARSLERERRRAALRASLGPDPLVDARATAVETLERTVSSIRPDEVASVLRWRLDPPPVTAAVVSVSGRDDAVAALLTALEGHPALRVVPVEGSGALRSTAVERAVSVGDPTATEAARTARKMLAGWIDEQGAHRAARPFVVLPSPPLEGVARHVEVGDDVAARPGRAARALLVDLQLEPEVPRRPPPRLPPIAGRSIAARTSGLEPALAAALELHADLDGLAAARAADPVLVREPMALVSQIQRSGGTLLSQLLDAHPQLHAHPHELHIGELSVRQRWPELQPGGDPGSAFVQLYEDATRFLHEGYRKSVRPRQRRSAAGEVPVDGGEPPPRPFLWLGSLARRIFFEACAGASTGRDWLDAWFTAYFNAWLDNANRFGEKRWVSAFAPALMTSAEARRAFFADYPDGRLLGVVRDPVSWWASARAFRHDRYGDRDAAVAVWAASTRALVDGMAADPARSLVIGFGELVEDTAATIGRVAGWLGIDDDEVLRVPTFNGEPIEANSSFAVPGTGVLAAPARRHEEVDAADRQAILAAVGDLHDEARAAIEARSAQLG